MDEAAVPPCIYKLRATDLIMAIKLQCVGWLVQVFEISVKFCCCCLWDDWCSTYSAYYVTVVVKTLHEYNQVSINVDIASLCLHFHIEEKIMLIFCTFV